MDGIVDGHRGLRGFCFWEESLEVLLYAMIELSQKGSGCETNRLRTN